MSGKGKRRAPKGVSSKRDQLLLSLLRAYAAGVLLAAVLLAGFSFIYSIKDLPLNLVNPITVAILIISSLTAGYVSAALIRERGLMWGAVCGALMMITLALLSSALNISSVGALLWIKLVICAVSGAIGGIFGVNYKPRRK